MKSSMIAAGMIGVGLLGATAALALTGDLNANGMRRIGRNVNRSAHKMGIEL